MYMHRTKNGGTRMKTILIVDDEDKIREVIREYAEFSGYEA